MATPTEIESLKSLRDTLAGYVRDARYSKDPQDKVRAQAWWSPLISLDSMAQLYGWWETGPDEGLRAPTSPPERPVGW